MRVVPQSVDCRYQAKMLEMTVKGALLREQLCLQYVETAPLVISVPSLDIHGSAGSELESKWHVVCPSQSHSSCFDIQGPFSAGLSDPTTLDLPQTGTG